MARKLQVLTPTVEEYAATAEENYPSKDTNHQWENPQPVHLSSKGWSEQGVTNISFRHKQIFEYIYIQKRYKQINLDQQELSNTQ